MRIALTRAAHASKRDRDTATYHHVTPQRIDATEFLTRGHLDSTHIQTYQYQTQGAKINRSIQNSRKVTRKHNQSCIPGEIISNHRQMTSDERHNKKTHNYHSPLKNKQRGQTPTRPPYRNTSPRQDPKKQEKYLQLETSDPRFKLSSNTPASALIKVVVVVIRSPGGYWRVGET